MRYAIFRQWRPTDVDPVQILRESIALDAEADPDREDPDGSWDLCECGDSRIHHHGRSEHCLLCRGSVVPESRCPKFRMVSA